MSLYALAQAGYTQKKDAHLASLSTLRRRARRCDLTIRWSRLGLNNLGFGEFLIFEQPQNFVLCTARDNDELREVLIDLLIEREV